MHVVGRLMTMTIGVATALIISVAPVGSASSITRWVDSDGRAGPRGCDSSAHSFTTIQSAVTASNADDTVIVCPGTYVEQVVIDGERDGLTLASSRPFGAAIKSPSVLARPLGFSFLVLVDRVDRVTIRGFKTIVRTQSPCQNVDGTVVGIGTRHLAIRGNRLMAPGSSSDAACFQADGIVVVDSTGPSSAARRPTGVVGFNEVRDTTYVGIGVFAANTTADMDIVHNSVRSYHGHPPVGGSALPTGRVVGLFGIGMFGRVRGSIRNNVVQGAGVAPAVGATFEVGIAASPTWFSTAISSNGPIDIEGNIVRRVVYGLWVAGADQLSVERDRITNTLLAGIFMEKAAGNDIQHNHIGAQGVGIFADASSTGNLLRRNSITGSGGSCQDLSTGGGTFGTANTWAGNSATVAGNPLGICPVAP